MLGRPQDTHCKSGCGLTSWYLKNENCLFVWFDDTCNKESRRSAFSWPRHSFEGGWSLVSLTLHRLKWTMSLTLYVCLSVCLSLSISISLWSCSKRITSWSPMCYLRKNSYSRHPSWISLCLALEGIGVPRGGPRGESSIGWQSPRGVIPKRQNVALNNILLLRFSRNLIFLMRTITL